MDTAILVEDLDKNAQKLIKNLYSKEFTVGALMKNTDAEDWYLVLGVPELRTKGSRYSFVAIYESIKENELNISLNDIKLLDDRDIVFGLLRQIITEPTGITRIMVIGNYINGLKFPNSIVYFVK